MFRSNGIVPVAVVIALMAATPRVLPASEQLSQKPVQRPAAVQRALEWETLTERQFKELPDSQPILFEGKRTTLGDVRLKMREWRQQAAARRAQAETRAKTAHAAALSRAQASIRAFEQEQQRKIAADTALMQGELARLRQQYRDTPSSTRSSAQIERIRQEAIDLNRRMRTASPTQREALNRRAGELLDELQKLGVQVPRRQ